jgi:UDP-N-acetyl-2-amino-2-deoxyglucuronate dehydrogenase
VFRPIEVAVIGAGRISERHFSAIGDPENGTRLIAICDIRAEVAQRVGLALGVSYFTSVDEMLAAHPNIGLVAVCTPSGTHFEIGMKLVNSGVTVLMEKPLTLSTQEAVELISSSKSRGVPVFVVKQNRLNPPVVEVRRRLESGALGKLLSATASVIWCRPAEYYLQDPWRLSRELDGGVVWNQASHYVDLLVNLLDPIVSVDAMGENFLSPSEAEDTVHAVMQSASGQIATLVATTTARPKNFEGSLTLVTEGGILKIGGHALNDLVANSTGKPLDLQTSMSGASDVDFVYGNGHSGVYQAVVRDLVNGEECEFRAERGLETVALIEAIHVSIAEGRRVSLDKVKPGTEITSDEGN